MEGELKTLYKFLRYRTDLVEGQTKDMDIDVETRTFLKGELYAYMLLAKYLSERHKELLRDETKKSGAV